MDWELNTCKHRNFPKQTKFFSNKTIKDGDIAPWKDWEKKLDKDKRKEQRNNYILIWGGSSSVSIFFMPTFAPSALRLHVWVSVIVMGIFSKE